MKPKKIYILMGNPDKEDTLSNDLADTYERNAIQAGHEVRRTNLIDMRFDPLLHKGYKVIQELEPDLLKAQEDLRWADHFVLVYPIWWSSMPSLLKAFFERMWLPHFAFHFPKGKLGWVKLLKGKTARVISLSRSQPWQMNLLFGNHTDPLDRALLGFSGYHVARTQIGGSENLSNMQKAEWRHRIGRLAHRGL